MSTQIDLMEPPPYLYKYRSFNRARIEEIVCGNALYASSPTQFNDPFDCYPFIDLTGTYEEAVAWCTIRQQRNHQVEITRNVIKRLAREVAKHGLGVILSDADTSQTWREAVQLFGVLSMAESPLDILMWSHYAVDHHGICLKFSTSKPPFRLCQKVTYVKDRPSFRPLDPVRGASLMNRVLLHKADFWSYEQEWRYAALVGGPGNVTFDPADLCQIILGAAVEPDNEAWLRALIANRSPQIEVKRALFHQREYRLTISD